MFQYKVWGVFHGLGCISGFGVQGLATQESTSPVPMIPVKVEITGKTPTPPKPTLDSTKQMSQEFGDGSKKVCMFDVSMDYSRFPESSKP